MECDKIYIFIFYFFVVSKNKSIFVADHLSRDRYLRL